MTVCILSMGASICRADETLIYGEQPDSGFPAPGERFLRLTVDFKGAAGNLGMYASGIPLGLMIDARGPRIALLIGAAALGGGYYPIHKGMVIGDCSGGLILICI
jgi:hypothetical protein